MKKTYEGASKVLVLDKMMQHVPIPSSLEEILLRVTCSPWMKRLWTLQEAVFAKQLFIQFSNGVVNIFERLNQERVPTITHTVYADCLVFLNDILLLRNPDWRGSDEFNRFVPVTNLLQHRTTSKPEDETICLSTLFSMNTARILNTPEPARMKTLLSSFPKVPPHMIFLSGPKLQVDGYRWAPATLLGRQHRTDTHDLWAGSSVSRTDEGLQVCFPGFEIKSAVGVKSEFFFIDRTERNWHMLEITKDVYPDDISSPTWDDIGSLDHCALILPRELSKSDEGEGIVCALVTFKPETRSPADTTSVKFESRAFVTRIAQGDIAVTPRYSSLMKMLEDGTAATSGKVAIATRFSNEHQWCIA